MAKVILFSYMQAKNDIFFISSSKLAFRRLLPAVSFSIYRVVSLSWPHKKAFFLLAIPYNSSIFALAEEKCGVLKLFLTRRKLVILFKSRNRTSIKMFHADHIGSGVQAYLLVLWVYQYLSLDKYELYVRLLFV